MRLDQPRPLLHVAVGVLRDRWGRVLVAMRAPDSHQGGLWEFPGGKVDRHEDVGAALARELREELGIEVVRACPLLEVRHDYPDRSVLLDTWEVTCYWGEPAGREGQPLEWLAVDQLCSRAFPAADGPIIEALKLPEHYTYLPRAVPEALRQALAAGRRLFAVPADTDWDQLICCERWCQSMGAQLLRAGGPWLQQPPGATGWHLPAAALCRLSNLPEHARVAADCDHHGHVKRARELGCGFVVVADPPTLSIPFYLPSASGLDLQTARSLGARGLFDQWPC